MPIISNENDVSVTKYSGTTYLVHVKPDSLITDRRGHAELPWIVKNHLQHRLGPQENLLPDGSDKSYWILDLSGIPNVPEGLRKTLNDVKEKLDYREADMLCVAPADYAIGAFLRQNGFSAYDTVREAANAATVAKKTALGLA